MNDIDDQYRRASAQDPSQPSESTRRNILANAASVAAQRAAAGKAGSRDFRRPAANQPTFLGTLAAAALAGLLMTPLFLPPRAPPPAERVTTVDHPALISAAAPAAMAPPQALSPASRAVSSAAAKAARTAPPAHRQYVPDVPSAAAGASADALQESATRESAGPARAAPRNLAVPPDQAGNSTLFGAAGAPAAVPRFKGGAMSASVAAAMLQHAAAAGDVDRLQSLLAIPVDINSRDDHGRTALMLATLEGQAGAVDTLLAHGADANAADSTGLTPLQAALARAEPGIAAALRRAGAH